MSQLTVDSINLLISCSNGNKSSVNNELKAAQSSLEVLKQVEYLNELIQSELASIFNPSVTQIGRASMKSDFLDKTNPEVLATEHSELT